MRWLRKTPGGTVLFLAWVAMLWWYGWLKFVVLFTLVCAGIFAGTVVAWGIYDAIRTRNDRETRQRLTAGCDEELDRLRQMAGLDK